METLGLYKIKKNDDKYQILSTKKRKKKKTKRRTET